MTRFARIAYTASVRGVQERNGSAHAMLRQLDGPDEPDPLGPVEQQFIAERDSFYLATVSETGWPYIQHRGGPPGFLHVLDEHTVAFADVGGNRQFITAGNLRHNDRVALFLTDYAYRTRLKLFGRARWQDAAEAPALADRLARPRTDGRVERLVTVTVEGFSWNCPKHITPRFSRAELDEVLQPIRDEISRLREVNRTRAAENDL